MKDKFYYKDGTTSSEYDISKQLHRENGPAAEYGSGTKLWYVDGKHYSEEDFNKLIEEAKELPLALRLIDPREWVRRL